MIFLAAFTSNQFQLNWAIAERWEDKVIEVKRIGERLIVVRIAVEKSVLYLVSV